MKAPGSAQYGNVQSSRPGGGSTSVPNGFASNLGFFWLPWLSFETENLAVLARQLVHGLRLFLMHL